MRSSYGLKLIVLVLLLCSGSLALAQGFTNSSLRGRVENEGAGLPGVLVTVKASTLQGERTTTTSSNGDYAFGGIPPGDYTVIFKLQGFDTVTLTTKLTAGQQSSLDTEMVLAGVKAAAVVSAKADTVSTTSTASTTLTSELAHKLPIARTIVSQVQLSSGISQVIGLGASQFSISGGQTFDNLYTVDGAVIIDNIRATPNNLFVEDAIQETTTSVSSISSEFGRFQGGIVNTITKSGGNTFSGSFRTSLTNDAWTAVSPAHETRVQKVTPRYEATIGGPFWKDHVWFFGSGRYIDTSIASQTVAPSGVAPIPFQIGDKEKRYQGKLTLTPLPNQTFTGNYLKVAETQSNNSFGNILDLDSLYTRTLPQRIITANYNGVLSSNFFVEGLYSQRKFTFQNSGSIYTDLIKGTLMRDRAFGNNRYNAPTFCGVCTPEERNNEDFLVKGTYFLSTPSLGSHNILLGYDHYAGSRLSNNHQSGSDYRVFTTNAIFQGGDIFPVVGPNSWVYYTPIDTLSQGTHALTHSAFLNDAWRLSDRLSFNLGVRYDKNNAANSLGVVTANDSAFSPRVAAAFDVKGDGKIKFNASYAHYVGAIQDSILDSTSAGGQPGLVYWYISDKDAKGNPLPGVSPAPVINNPPGSTLTTRAEALRQIFDWFFAQGCPSLATCKLRLVGAPSIPGLTSAITTSLKSPYAREYTFGINGAIGSGAYRMDFVRRDFFDFYNTILNTSTGQIKDPTGRSLDFSIVGNTNNLERNYTALQTQLQWRFFNNRLNLSANWTWAHTLGNFDGENAGSGPITAITQQYPEYKNSSWNNPRGDLITDQRHRVRVFGAYDLPFIPQNIGSLSIGVVQAYDSGVPYGAVGSVGSSAYVTNPGYASPPSSVTYYYTARDAFRTDSIKRTDVSLSFSSKIAGLVEIFVVPQVTNLFNNHGVIAVDTTVLTARSTGGGANAFAAFNPFTTTPVQRPNHDTSVKNANWDTGLSFGKPRNNADYQLPRQFSMTVGLRF